MKYILLLLSLFLLGGCDNDTAPKVSITGSADVREYVIEGCQYLGKLNGDGRSCFLTHKGNCNNPIHKTNQQ